MSEKVTLKNSYEEYIEEVKDNVSAKTMAEQARKGNVFCKAVYKRSGEMLGRTLSIITDVLNPEKIVIGGVYMRANDLLYPHARKIMEKECLSYSLSAVEVVPAGLSENIGDYASLAVAEGGYR